MLVRPAQKIVRNWVSDSRHWDRVRPRGGDVIIVTAPKTGTTWMQQIVNLLVFQSPEPRNLGALSPWIDCRFQMPIDAVIPMIEAQTHRRFLKAHLPFDALPVHDDARYVFVSRDGRDAGLSYHNHYTSLFPGVFGRLDAIGTGDETIGRAIPRPPTAPREFFRGWLTQTQEEFGMIPFAGYLDIFRSCWRERHLENLLMVHYADLKADLSGEMKRIADFLGITVPGEVWPGLVEAATFTRMKRDGDALLPTLKVAFKGGHDTFLHRGENERWRDVLTQEDLDLYDQKIATELSPAQAAWQRAGRMHAGDPRSVPD